MEVLVRLMVNLYIIWAAQNAYRSCQPRYAHEKREMLKLCSLATPYEYPQVEESSFLYQRHGQRLRRCQRDDHVKGAPRRVLSIPFIRTDAIADGESD